MNTNTIILRQIHEKYFLKGHLVLFVSTCNTTDKEESLSMEKFVYF